MDASMLQEGQIADKRHGWADASRGVAILLVVVGHAIHILMRRNVDLPGWFEGLDRALYTFHVPVFFLIAGLFAGASLQQRSVRAFLGQRAVRLLYPYLVWSGFQLAVECLAGIVPKDAMRGEWLRILYFPRAHFWFLPVLFISLTYLSIAVQKQVLRVNRLTGLFLLSCILYALHLWLPAGLARDTGRHLVYVMIGAVIGNSGMLDNGEGPKCQWCSVAALIFAGGLITGAVRAGVETSLFMRLPLGLAGILAVCRLSSLIAETTLGTFLQWVGRNSLNIYVIHVLMIYCVLESFSRIGLPVGGWLLLPAIGGGVLLPCLVAWIGRRTGTARFIGLSRTA